MKYDCFDYGLCEEAPLTHRKYKCKICKVYINPTFQCCALWWNYWRADHIRFCYDHSGDEIKDWLRGHIKYELVDHWRKTYRETIDTIVEIYLLQKERLTEMLENPKLIIGVNDLQ